jgi:Na+/H+-dicarboxylate symporter
MKSSRGSSLARAHARWRSLSLTTRILIGLGVGVLIGLFLGDDARALQGIANAYIGLMQMTVIPYLLIALILGLGRLELAKARLLAAYGGLVLLVFWVVTLAVIWLVPLTFPTYQSAFFFSTTILEPRQPISFVDLYIPSNPFHSLANTLVPAVTLFAAAVGVALITLEDKERFLAPLDVLMKAIGRITNFVVELTPLGVIAVVAVAAGTLSPDEVSRLQVYLIVFVVASLLLGFVLLPLVVTAVTPFRYGEVVGTCRDALLTAFVTHSVFIVLPMIAEKCAELARAHDLDPRSARSVPEVVVPIAFNFPTAGKLLTLLFVPFAAWLSGSALEAGDYPRLLTTGVFTYFAKAQVALPLLMDLVEVPQDLFQLYIPTTLLTGKFDSAVGAMSLFAFALIVAAAMSGRLHIGVLRVLRSAVVGIAIVAVTLVATRVALGALVDTTYTKAQALEAMHLSRSPPPTAVYRSPPPPDAYASRDLSPLERIRSRRTIRVGYLEDRLPFTFFNAHDQFVGFDVELTAQMARDLGVGIEWIPVRWNTFGPMLMAGTVDLVPSVPYMHRTVGRIGLSTPYVDGTIGLLVRDARRNEFASEAELRQHERLLIGVTAEPEIFEIYLKEMLDDTPYELVEIERLDPAFESEKGRLDAVLVIAEEGMAWSLVRPEYSVVIPKDHVLRRPLAYAMRPDAGELAEFVNEWLVLQKARGGIDSAYNFWILGNGAEERPPRWSIERNVLGWK